MIELIVAMWLSFYPAPDMEPLSRRCGACWPLK